MAAQPIKSLELHYAMIQFLIKEYRPYKTAIDLLIGLRIILSETKPCTLNWKHNQKFKAGNNKSTFHLNRYNVVGLWFKRTKRTLL